MSVKISPFASAFAVPLEHMQALNPSKRLVVGVAIATSSSLLTPNPTSSKRLLIVRRAASESDFAGLYELPGGGSEPEDNNLIDTVVRETIEETGLKVTEVLGTFEGFEYETKGGKSVQFNFLVRVNEGKGAAVKLNPEEHDTYAWVGPEDAETMQEKWGLSGAMEVCVKDALEVLESI
ncbi:NUDIX hydrolase domain-like protein [Ephemerocybe angulata]|uniref:NUDIX hydrolase domain-like protein n=1 Tax=Ephemerocybe angulata TaxID=980116 RepID=A0A8H6LV07_9AGAR|nr:NUDIX hydrolase domain-like protein [Tulosesus angulatus]